MRKEGFWHRMWRRVFGAKHREGLPAVVKSGETTPVPISPTRNAGERVPGSPRLAVKPVERTIVVGVDFGTSTTKVMWQDLTTNDFELVQWFPESGLAGFLLPSNVTCRGGLLKYGTRDSDTQQDDVTVSSIKLCVLCRRNKRICSCGNAVAQNGNIRLPGSDRGYAADVFGCLFLAYVFRSVEQLLEGRFPHDQMLMIWNIGCPMDHLDEDGRRQDWERMAGVAMDLANEEEPEGQTRCLDDVEKRLTSHNVQPDHDRNYFIQPEGLAAVKAFLESPHAEAKTYAIVDVGAGTTEVSFFFNGQIISEPGHPLRPSYLADSTQAVGGLKIDSELAGLWRCDIAFARQRKQTRTLTVPALKSLQEIYAQYGRTCWEIVKGQKLVAAHDKHFDLFVIGGGGRLQRLHDELRGQSLPGGFVCDRSRSLEPPRKLRNRVAILQDYDFFANACGLASSLSWDYYPPHEVAPMVVATKVRPRIDPDEYYPK